MQKSVGVAKLLPPNAVVHETKYNVSPQTVGSSIIINTHLTTYISLSAVGKTWCRSYMSGVNAQNHSQGLALILLTIRAGISCEAVDAMAMERCNAVHTSSVVATW